MSIVSNLIDFQIQKDSETFDVLLSKIIEFYKKGFKISEERYKDSLVNFVYYVNLCEEHGVVNKEEIKSCINLRKRGSKEERETVNIVLAYEFLCSQGNEFLLTTELIKEVHRLILKDIDLPKGYTKPGVFSKKQRLTTYKGETYVYENPDNIEEKVQNTLDKYNDLITHLVLREDDFEKKVPNLFKTCAWVITELLSIHPFSDGNGRLCRLICSYILTLISPFPTPIYNPWKKDKSRTDFIDFLQKAQGYNPKRPEELSALIVACNYYNWKEFTLN